MGFGQVYSWITKQEHAEIRAIMQKHGRTGPVSALVGLQGQPDKTRGSVYATAQRMASAIANDKLLAWTSAPGVRRFNAEVFVRGTDTAVLISRNGPGSGGAFVAALVRSISRAGERAAAADGGRITTPGSARLRWCSLLAGRPISGCGCLVAVLPRGVAAA